MPWIPETAYALAREIEGLTGSVTVLVMSHRPEFMDIADRIYRVEAGTVELATADVQLAGARDVRRLSGRRAEPSGTMGRACHF